MTHSGGQPHENVGDRGQRYEISVIQDGEPFVVGWTDDAAKADKICVAVAKNPAWTHPRIRDRKREQCTCLCHTHRGHQIQHVVDCCDQVVLDVAVAGAEG